MPATIRWVDHLCSGDPKLLRAPDAAWRAASNRGIGSRGAEDGPREAAETSSGPEGSRSRESTGAGDETRKAASGFTPGGLCNGSVRHLAWDRYEGPLGAALLLARAPCAILLTKARRGIVDRDCGHAALRLCA